MLPGHAFTLSPLAGEFLNYFGFFTKQIPIGSEVFKPILE